MGLCPDTKVLIGVLVSHYNSFAEKQEEIYLTLVRVARTTIALEQVHSFLHEPIIVCSQYYADNTPYFCFFCS